MKSTAKSAVKPPSLINPQELPDEEFARLAKILLRHVRWRAKKMFGWLGTEPDDLGLGNQCEDIVRQAIDAIWDEPANWGPMSADELLERLKSKANGDLINLRRKTQRHAKGGEQWVEFLEFVGELPESAHEVVVFRRFCDEVETAILESSDEESLMILFDFAREHGHLSPSDLAHELKIPPREADGLKRKLRKLVNEVRVRLGEKPVRSARGAVR